MARPSTVARVHRAVIDLATEHGPPALTMEGIAARAGVGKQTLYRTWRSVPEILFDALLADSSAVVPAVPDTAPDTATDDQSADDDHPVRIQALLRHAAEEIGTEPRTSMLRALAAAIQVDEEVARAYRERLHGPQLMQVEEVLAAGGCAQPARAAELLLAPVFYRWFMRLAPMTEIELRRHVRGVLELTARGG